MAKNIVLCSDGTGQAGGQGSVSNVWRLFKAVDRHKEGTVQVAFHVDGVGTESNKYFRAFSGAFGWGLSKDIRMLYASLVRSYKPGDRIFLFGFSRGAFTVRSLAGMIHQIGILKNVQFKSDAKIDDAVAAAYRSYRKDEKPDLSGTYEIHEKRDIEFVGVWDTVDAIGVPIDKMRDAIYAIAKFWRRPHKDGLNTSIKKACHAISIDDERQTFHPKIWDETGFEGKVEQVWFAGVHSNVGGGYPKDSLSYIPLDWIMKKAQERGLQFLSSKWVAGLKPGKPFGDIQEQADKHGRIYDSRGGAAIYYRYKPRNIETLWSEAQTGKTLPTIHESVLKRIESGYTGYAPTAIQGSFKWVDTWIGKNGTVNSVPDLGKAWSYIEKRHYLYKAFLIWTVAFLSFGVFMDGGADDPCGDFGFCASTLSAVKSATPDFMSGWLGSYWNYGWVLFGFIAALIVMGLLRCCWKRAAERAADEAWYAFSFQTVFNAPTGAGGTGEGEPPSR